MIKRIVAILLICAMMLTVTSCKSIVKTPADDNRVYYVDEEGHTQYVEKDGDGKYYITDGEGVTTYIEDEKYLNQIKENEEKIAQEGIQNIIDSGIEDTTEKAENDKLQISDGLIKEEANTENTQKAKDAALNRIKSYQELLRTKKYTIKGTIKQGDGEDMSYPIVYIRNGEDFFIEAAIPFEKGKVIKANMIYVGGVAYCVIPSLKVYYNAGKDIGDEMGVGTFSDVVVEKYTFVETSKVTLNGKSYTCDKFTFEGDTYKYIYDSNNNLVRIEEIFSKNDYVIAEISSMSPKADTSKIKKPKGIDITSMIG